MKNFDEFVKSLPAEDISDKVQLAVQASVATASDDTNALAKIIATASFQVSLSLLAKYHAWLEE